MTIERGGTGAETSADACKNLGAMRNAGGTFTGTVYFAMAPRTMFRLPVMLILSRSASKKTFQHAVFTMRCGATTPSTCLAVRARSPAT